MGRPVCLRHEVPGQEAEGGLPAGSLPGLPRPMPPPARSAAFAGISGHSSGDTRLLAQVPKLWIPAVTGLAVWPWGDCEPHHASVPPAPQGSQRHPRPGGGGQEVPSSPDCGVRPASSSRLRLLVTTA